MTENNLPEGVVERPEGETGVSGQPFKTPEQQLALFEMPVGNLSDGGEEGAIKEYLGRDLEEFMTPEMLPLLKALVKIQRGDLTEAEEQGFQKAFEFLTKKEKSRKEFEENEQGFVERAEERRESLLKSPEEQARIKARVAKEYQNELRNLQARRLSVEDRLKEEPQEMIVWPFTIEFVSNKGQIQPRRRAKVFSAGGYKRVEAPGANIKVPKSIARWAETFWKNQEETEMRKDAVNTKRSTTEAAKLWNKANEMSSGPQLPTG